jgi:hypothetical protein
VHGHVDLLRWLVDNGCPWVARDLCIAAAIGGCVEVLTYLQQQGILTCTAALTDLLDLTGSSNKLAAAQWLREQGAGWPTTYDHHPWSGAVLEWAIGEGFIPPTN